MRAAGHGSDHEPDESITGVSDATYWLTKEPTGSCLRPIELLIGAAYYFQLWTARPWQPNAGREFSPGLLILANRDRSISSSFGLYRRNPSPLR
jgi:hypothetical protein